jgi:hypothetical protein
VVVVVVVDMEIRNLEVDKGLEVLSGSCSFCGDLEEMWVSEMKPPFVSFLCLCVGRYMKFRDVFGTNYLTFLTHFFRLFLTLCFFFFFLKV